MDVPNKHGDVASKAKETEIESSLETWFDGFNHSAGAINPSTDQYCGKPNDQSHSCEGLFAKNTTTQFKF